MDSPGGQSPGTRAKLLDAGVAVLAEVGWGRVTTRAIAARAGVPHGAVSYHFHGKQALLEEAVLRELEAMFPFAALASLTSLGDVVEMMRAALGSAAVRDVTRRAVVLEAAREAGRSAALRRRLAELLRDYRRVVEARVDPASASADPSAIATLVAAVGDGLMIHAMLDPDLDVGAAIDALQVLTTPKPGPRRSAS